jgi:exodeoxyribonuclease V alpha subunit
MSHKLLMPSLKQLVSLGALGLADRHFAQVMMRLSRVDDLRVGLALAKASQAVLEGHVCFDLESCAGGPIYDGEGQPLEGYQYPEKATWIGALEESGLIGSAEEETPLVCLDERRLYLRKYWEYERVLADRIRVLSALPPEAVPQDRLKSALDDLFGDDSRVKSQRDAAETALSRRFCVITGGPGTGKTSTIVKILILLQRFAEMSERGALNIKLLAPTGKAANRLANAVQKGLMDMGLDDETSGSIPLSATTIHRCLKKASPYVLGFRHNRSNPIPADVVIVDEASMVDVALMCRLLDAVREDARIVLLGDPHQLTSVEAGSILGDICSAGRSSDKQHRVTLPGPGGTMGLRGSVKQLDHNWRFDAESLIGQLSHHVRSGASEEVMKILSATEEKPGRDVRDKSVCFIDARKRPFTELIKEVILPGWRPFLSKTEPGEVISSMDEFRVLCPHRLGPVGANRVNAQVEAAFTQAGHIKRAAGQQWYSHRPVMVTTNDYHVGLFNGDVGAVLRDSEESDGLFSYFPDESGGDPMRLTLAQMPVHETVFATTVHKSQGSEFRSVLLILPVELTRLLTRELIYTAITRARENVIIWGDLEVVGASVERPVQRMTGLAEAICEQI